MFNRDRKRLSAEVFSSAQKQPKQNASNQNREENGSTTLRNTREKPLLAGYLLLVDDKITACVKEIFLLGVVCKGLNRRTLSGATFCFPEKRLLSILMLYFKTQPIIVFL